MKKFFSILFISLILSCSTNNKNVKEVVNAQAQLEKDLELYQDIWNRFLAGDTSTVNSENFTEDVVVVTDQGDIVGIENCLLYTSPSPRDATLSRMPSSA